MLIVNQGSNVGAAFEANLPKGLEVRLDIGSLFYHLSSLQDYSNAFDLHLWEGNI